MNESGKARIRTGVSIGLNDDGGLCISDEYRNEGIPYYTDQFFYRWYNRTVIYINGVESANFLSYRYRVFQNRENIEQFIVPEPGFELIWNNGVSQIVYCEGFVLYCNIYFKCSTANTGISIQSCQTLARFYPALGYPTPFQFANCHTMSNRVLNATQEVVSANVGLAYFGDATSKVLRFDFPYGVYSDYCKFNDQNHITCIGFSAIGLL